MFYVYFLRSKETPNRLYVGYSADLRERIKRHNAGLVQSTKPYRPWEIIFYEAYKISSDAKRREQYLKTTKGRKGLRLILRDSLK